MTASHPTTRGVVRFSEGALRSLCRTAGRWRNACRLERACACDSHESSDNDRIDAPAASIRLSRPLPSHRPPTGARASSRRGSRVKVIRQSGIDVCAIVGAKFASSDAVAGMLLEAGCMRREDEARVRSCLPEQQSAPKESPPRAPLARRPSRRRSSSRAARPWPMRSKASIEGAAVCRRRHARDGYLEL